MRMLYREFYLKGKGFTTQDMIGIVNRLTRRDYRDFYRKHVSGVEIPAYDTILGYAGYKIESSSRKTPLIGVGLDSSSEGLKITRVDPGGPASKAGLQAGDILVSIDGLDAQKDFQAVMGRLAEKIDRSVKLSIKGAGKDETLDLEVGSRSEAEYKIVELLSPTPDQLKIREAWLKVGK
jgi:predicted metalloprotease with PDZ domain